jgi:hypothetical protein
MTSKAMSLKAKINNYAKSKNIPAQVVLQNVMFERFLERLSKSTYRDKFVIKGGMLILALVGLDTRMTMDLDTTLRRLSLTETQVEKAIKDICTVCIFSVMRSTIVQLYSLKLLKQQHDIEGHEKEFRTLPLFWIKLNRADLCIIFGRNTGENLHMQGISHSRTRFSLCENY